MVETLHVGFLGSCFKRFTTYGGACVSPVHVPPTRTRTRARVAHHAHTHARFHYPTDRSCSNLTPASRGGLLESSSGNRRHRSPSGSGVVYQRGESCYATDCEARNRAGDHHRKTGGLSGQRKRNVFRFHDRERQGPEQQHQGGMPAPRRRFDLPEGGNTRRYHPPLRGCGPSGRSEEETLLT